MGPRHRKGYDQAYNRARRRAIDRVLADNRDQFERYRAEEWAKIKAEWLAEIHDETA
jgi:hypothetical protein